MFAGFASLANLRPDNLDRPKLFGLLTGKAYWPQLKRKVPMDWTQASIGKNVAHLDKIQRLIGVQCTETATRAILKDNKTGKTTLVDCTRPDGRRDWMIKTLNIGNLKVEEVDPCQTMETTRVSVKLPHVTAARADLLATARGIDRDTLICQLINATEEGLLCADSV